MSKRLFLSGAAAVLAVLLLAACQKPETTSMRLLYWNIQNGMWDGQNDNYDRFVNWVKEQDPDMSGAKPSPSG